MIIKKNTLGNIFKTLTMILVCTVIVNCGSQRVKHQTPPAKTSAATTEPSAPQKPAPDQESLALHEPSTNQEPSANQELATANETTVNQDLDGRQEALALNQPETQQQVSDVKSSNPQETTGGSFAIYGNWCGPDHPKNITMPVAPGPVDQLDAACMIHDYCYAERGGLDCDCDEELTGLLKQQLASNEYTRSQAIAARGIHNYFTASPCKDHTGNSQGKTAANRGMYRLYEGIKRRAVNVYDAVTGGE